MFSVAIRYKDGPGAGVIAEPVSSFDSYNEATAFIDEYESRGIDFVYTLYEHAPSGSLCLVATTDCI